MPPVPYRLLADLTLLLHLAFILFAVLGGLLVLRWRRLIWVHLTAVIWAALIEFAGWVCPLTPLENHFRRLAGQRGYEGGFIEHYLVRIIYPAGLTREMQIALGLFVLAVNLGIYALVLHRKLGRRPDHP